MKFIIIPLNKVLLPPTERRIKRRGGVDEVDRVNKFCIRLSAENDPESERDEEETVTNILGDRKKTKEKYFKTYLKDVDYLKFFEILLDLSNIFHYLMHIHDEMLVDNLNTTIKKRKFYFYFSYIHINILDN